MEVHHHPHVEKKNFKEYFLEFIMIFLAVSMGFFAESLREHSNNKTKEKDFIVSFREDMLTDTAGLNHAVFRGALQYEKLDSLYILLRSVIEQKPVNIDRLYYLNFQYAFGLEYFKPDKRTISQIQNTGSFSLITNRKCRDGITVFENYNDDEIKENADDYKDRLVDLNKMSQKIFNYDHAKTFGFLGSAEAYLNDSLKLKLITNDKTLLNEYANKVRSLMMIENILILTENKQIKRCKGLIVLLDKEYHLKKEE